MAIIDVIQKKLNVQPDGIPTVVRLSQNENGRELVFDVENCEIPAGSTVTISGTKPDGNVYSLVGSITDNTVTFAEDIQMTAVGGQWDAKVVIVNGGNTVATGRVRMIIDPDTVDPDAVPSDSQLEGLVAQAQEYAEYAKGAAYGAPYVASTVAQMTDHDHVYVYTGSETGYTAGNWYYWNGSAWTSGGTYNSVAVATDKTLAVSDMAADAKVTGDKIADLKSAITQLDEDAFPDSVFNWELGTLSTATGVLSDSTTNMRTQKLRAKTGSTFKGEVAQSYVIVAKYDKTDGHYLGSLGGWSKNYTLDVDCDVIVLAKKEDTSTISDISALANHVHLNILSDSKIKESEAVYTNVANMVVDANLIPNKVCKTLGYYSANDGGGGVYLVRQRAVGETENGGSVIFLNNGYTAELIPEKHNVLNFKQWGAVADGSTNNSPIYGKCIDYIKENFPVSYVTGDGGTGGAIIFIPSGVYHFNTQLEARHYVKVMGENRNTTILKSTASRMFYSNRDNYTSETEIVGRQTRFTLSNLTFKNSACVLNQVQSIDTVIEHCNFLNITENAIVLYLTVKITIYDCYFYGCNEAIILGTTGVGPSTAVTIEKCWIRHCVKGLVITCGTNACGIQPCSVVDTIFEYNRKAIEVEGSETYPTLITFNRCYFEGNTESGTIVSASVFADMQTFFDPVGQGVTVTPSSYNKAQISNLSDTIGFTVTT